MSKKQTLKNLASALEEEDALDTKSIELFDTIIGHYRDARDAVRRRRRIARMMRTAIKHGDTKRVKMLAEDWRIAGRKIKRYKF